MAKDTEILAMWFLNVLNAITKGHLTPRILKIRIFALIRANAFKSDKSKLETYLNMKGSTEYYEIIDAVVKYLLKQELIKLGANTALVSITRKGVEKCKEESSWNSRYYKISSDDERPYMRYK